MTILQSIILGIVQGIGEFLPISSSAHLILVPWLFNWEDAGLTFDVALHAGTLIALLVHFRHVWMEMIRQAFKIRLDDLKHVNDPLVPIERRLVPYLVVATIPGAIIGLLLEKKVESEFRDPRLIAANLALMGVILWIYDRKGRKSRMLTDFTMTDALIIGVAQGLAVIPGISRAGITITAALVRGFNREDSARFSFYLSMPIIAGACILKLRHLTGADLTPVFMAGVLSAAISGYFAISGLIRYLQTRSYGIFALYRLAVAAAVAVIIATHIR